MASVRVEPIAAIGGEWDRLADANGATPFARRWWAQAWSDAFCPANEPIRTLTVRTADGQLSAVLPVVVHGRRFTLPINGHWPYLDPLAESDEARAHLADGLLERLGPYVRIGPFREGDPFTPILVDRADAARRVALVRKSDSSPVIAFDHNEPLSSLSSRSRRDLRRRRRRMDEEGNTEFTVAVNADDALCLLDEFAEIENKGWKHEEGTAIAQRPEEFDFYRRLVLRAASDDALWFNRLSLDGRAVACSLDIKGGSDLFSLKCAYDPEFARFSPGNLLMAEVAMESARHGLVRWETLGDDEPYKRKWTDDIDQLVMIDVYRRSLFGRAHFVLARLGPAVRRRTRPLVDALRQRLSRTAGQNTSTDQPG